jgi:hypothetical protein
MSDVFLVGSTVRVRIYVRDPATGDLANGTVDLVIQDPSGNETPEIPTNTSTGIYDFYLDLDEEGQWTAIWTVTVGSFTGVEECCVSAVASVLVGSA